MRVRPDARRRSLFGRDDLLLRADGRPHDERADGASERRAVLSAVHGGALRRADLGSVNETVPAADVRAVASTNRGAVASTALGAVSSTDRGSVKHAGAGPVRAADARAVRGPVAATNTGADARADARTHGDAVRAADVVSDGPVRKRRVEFSTSKRVAAPPRVPRGYSAEAGRGTAAGATRIFRGGGSRHCHVDIPWGPDDSNAGIASGNVPA